MASDKVKRLRDFEDKTIAVKKIVPKTKEELGGINNG